MPVPRNVHPLVGQARARLASLTARGADPERIAEARAELAEANAVAAVDKLAVLPAQVRMRLAAQVLAGDGTNAA